MRYVLIACVCLVVGLVCGAVFQIRYGEVVDANARAILAFRAMGCAPYYTRTGALNAGCDKIIRLEIEQ